MKTLQKLVSFIFILSLQGGLVYAQAWSITGNAGTSSAVNFVGTTDKNPLIFRVNNQKSGYLGYDITQARTALGYQALITANGVRNSAFGYRTLYLSTTGAYNTGMGAFALSGTTTGNGNSAFGASALYFNKTGHANVAIGSGALYNNTDGHNLVAVGDSALFYQALGTTPTCEFCDTARLYENTAVGSKALFRNTSGYDNTATGFQALYWNTSAANNTGNGYRALYNNYYGWDNTAVGSYALGGNVGGYYNTAIGSYALPYSNSSSNSAVGHYAMNQNYSGTQNSALGDNALFFNYTGSYNTGVGYRTLYPNTSTSKNTAIGWSAGDFHTSSACTWVGHKASSLVDGADNSTGVGYLAYVSASNQVRLGSNYVTSIGGYANWSNVSDGRIKRNIKANVPGLEFINKLAPVTYNLDLAAAENILNITATKDEKGKVIQPDANEIKARKAKQEIVYTGFIAQDVEKAAKELQYEFSGVDAAKNDKDLYGLRYAEFVVPLVKAVQQLSAQNDEMKKEIAELKSMVLAGNQNTVSNASPKNLSGAAMAERSSLGQNTPNPSQGRTTISYNLSNTVSAASLLITDMSGRVLKTIPLNTKGAGQVVINSNEFAAGNYSYTLVADGSKIATKQMMLTK